MKRFYLIAGILMSFILTTFLLAQAQESTPPALEELQKRYVPQKSPEEAFHLELELLLQGIYAYDLPLFDSQWRKKGSQIIQSDSFLKTVEEVNKPFQSYVEGALGVIYFPQNPQIAPVFFYQNEQGWVIDRTKTNQSILFEKRKDGGWVVLSEENPYFSLISKLYTLERLELRKGLWGYRIKPSKA